MTTRLALPLLVLAVPACTDTVELHSDAGPDGNTIVFDAPTDARIDAEEPGDGCLADINCPPPSPGRNTVCGRLWDVQTDQLIPPATGATGAQNRCGSLDRQRPPTPGLGIGIGLRG